MLSRPTGVTTVSIVEDELPSQNLVIHALGRSKRLEVVSVHSCADDALEKLPALRPAVVLMDITLPGMSGIECVRSLRTLAPPLKMHIIMLTEHEDPVRIFDALKAGADGYLLKRQASGNRLEAAIEEVLAGGGPMSPGVARKVIAYFQTIAPTPPGPAPIGLKPSQPLSARQQEVLNLLTEGLMYKEIAARLGVSIDGIRKHLQSIYQKLHVRSRWDPALHNLRRPVSN